MSTFAEREAARRIIAAFPGSEVVEWSDPPSKFISVDQAAAQMSSMGPAPVTVTAASGKQITCTQPSLEDALREHGAEVARQTRQEQQLEETVEMELPA